jgi:hypothetical protein
VADGGIEAATTGRGPRARAGLAIPGSLAILRRGTDPRGPPAAGPGAGLAVAQVALPAARVLVAGPDHGQTIGRAADPVGGTTIAATRPGPAIVAHRRPAHRGRTVGDRRVRPRGAAHRPGSKIAPPTMTEGSGVASASDAMTMRTVRRPGGVGAGGTAVRPAVHPRVGTTVPDARTATSGRSRKAGISFLGASNAAPPTDHRDRSRAMRRRAPAAPGHRDDPRARARSGRRRAPVANGLWRHRVRT